MAKGQLISECPFVSISSCQPNLMKTYHNEANPSGITKIVSKIFVVFLGNVTHQKDILKLTDL